MQISYDNFMSSLRIKLLASPFVTPLIGTDIGSDTMFGTEYNGTFNDGWIFRGQGDAGAPARNPENSGTSSVTLNFRDPASGTRTTGGLRIGPSPTTSSRRLIVYIFSDVTRDPSNLDLITAFDAEDRCNRIATAIVNELNDPGNNNHWWPNNVYITSSELSYELSIRDTTDSDNLVRGELIFSIIVD